MMTEGSSDRGIFGWRSGHQWLPWDEGNEFKISEHGIREQQGRNSSKQEDKRINQKKFFKVNT